MSTAFYSREALRRLREQQELRASAPQRAGSLLEQVPPDVPMDDATLTIWNGERFVAFTKWLATVSIEREEDAGDAVALDLSTDADCVTAECGGTRVWLLKEGERWLMFAGSRRPTARRRDFASPFLRHAVQTAEAWYGPAVHGWRAEKRTPPAGKETLNAHPAL